jgi:hypothetical protein
MYPVAVKRRCPGCPVPSSFLYSFCILLNLFSSYILLKYCSLDVTPSINQSINQSINILLLLLSLYFTVVLCLSSSCVLCTQSCQWIVHFVIALSVFSNTYFNTKILFVHNIYSFLFIYSLSNRLVKQHNTKWSLKISKE